MGNADKSRGSSQAVGRSPLMGRRVAVAAGLALVLAAEPAIAADRVVWKRRTAKEVDGSWKVEMEIHLSRPPDVPHIPVRFSFTPITYFERALVDGRKDPVLRKIPLSDQQPIVESVDAGFMDSSSGKAARRTRFSFRVTRDRGFAAGQYEVEVTNSRSGKKMGGKVTLTLEGDNEVIDRRSIVFDDKKEKDSSGKEPKAPPPREKELTAEDDEFWAGGPRQPEEPDAPLPPPAHLQEKPGCGCRVAGSHRRSGPAWLGAVVALGLIARRRLRPGATPGERSDLRSAPRDAGPPGADSGR